MHYMYHLVYIYLYALHVSSRIYIYRQKNLEMYIFLDKYAKHKTFDVFLNMLICLHA